MASPLSGRRFAPKLHWTALAVAGVVLFVALGRWQLDRAGQKRELFEGFAAGDAAAVAVPDSFEPVERYRRIRARGSFDTSRQFLLDNMTHAGRPGYHVLTPLVRPDGRIVLVDRGFIPLPPSRDELPAPPVDGGVREVEGRADQLPRAAVQLDAPPTSGWPRRMSFPRMSDIRQALGAEVFPQVLLLDAAEPDGFLRDWQPPGMAPEKHLGYAVQWFGLALTVAVTWAVLSFRPREST